MPSTTQGEALTVCVNWAIFQLFKTTVVFGRKINKDEIKQIRYVNTQKALFGN